MGVRQSHRLEGDVTTVPWLMAAGAVVVAAAAALSVAWHSKHSEPNILGQAAKPATTASPAAAPSTPAEAPPVERRIKSASATDAGGPCAYHLSHPDIFVMESAEEWDSCK
jgi:hypothetical protein